MSADYAGLGHRVTALEKDMGDVRKDVTSLKRDRDDFRDVLYGDPDRQTIGLVQRDHDVADLLRQWSALMRIGKWVAASFGTATVALVVNVLGGGLS